MRKVGLKVWDHNLITIAFTKDMKGDIFVFFDSLKVDLAKIASEKKSAEESADKEKSSLSQLKAQLLELEDEFTKIKDTYEARVNDLQNKLKESLEEMDKISKDKQNLLTR